MPPHRCMAPELFRNRASLRHLAFVLVALASRVSEAPLTRQRPVRLASLLLLAALAGIELVGALGALGPFCPSRARATFMASKVVSV